MSRTFNMSRRNLVTLATGAVAAGAVPTAAVAATNVSAAIPNPATLLALTRERVLWHLQCVRRAPGAGSRARAFGALAAAVRVHSLAGSQVAATRGSHEAGTLTALYRGSEPESVLAQVMIRELEARAAAEPAWMTRFAELEAILLNQTA